MIMTSFYKPLHRRTLEASDAVIARVASRHGNVVHGFRVETSRGDDRS